MNALRVAIMVVALIFSMFMWSLYGEVVPKPWKIFQHGDVVVTIMGDYRHFIFNRIDGRTWVGIPYKAGNPPEPGVTYITTDRLAQIVLEHDQSCR